MGVELFKVYRGYIYEFKPVGKQKLKPYALVVSTNEINQDNVINVILLSPNPHYECVPVDVENNRYYINVGKITFTQRCNLLRQVCKLPDKEMEYISDKLRFRLELHSPEADLKMICNALIRKYENQK